MVFNRYPVKEGEELSLSPIQTAHLHNLLIDEIEAKVEIVFDEATPIKHIQQQAYLTGRIDLLKQLLTKE